MAVTRTRGIENVEVFNAHIATKPHVLDLIQDGEPNSIFLAIGTHFLDNESTSASPHFSATKVCFLVTESRQTVTDGRHGTGKKWVKIQFSAACCVDF